MTAGEQVGQAGRAFFLWSVARKVLVPRHLNSQSRQFLSPPRSRPRIEKRRSDGEYPDHRSLRGRRHASGESPEGALGNLGSRRCRLANHQVIHSVLAFPQFRRHGDSEKLRH